MPYKIDFRERFTEVMLYGDATEWDVMQAIQQMSAMDPRKERPDLWVVSPASVLPLSTFVPIIEALKSLCVQLRTGMPSAVVSTNALQRAQLSLFLTEATTLPYKVKIFENRDEAVAWLEDTSPPAHQRA